MKKLAIVVLILLCAGSASAYDLYQHVNQAPTNRGDALIFPHYLGLPGWETKLTVTNTDTAYSMVAKLIVRSGQYSIELRDFLIYLSPADVWTGRIYYGATGPRIQSGDDSVLAAPGVWATPANPMDIDLELFCDDNRIGYVTVIEAWSSNDFRAPGNQWGCDLGDTTAPVSKDCIFDAYNNYFDESQDDPGCWLTGHYEISILGAVTAADTATVLRDYENTIQLLPTVVSTLGTGADNNLCEVEAALNKNLVALPYKNTETDLAVHWFNFPTKLSVVNPATCEYISPYTRGPFAGFKNPDNGFSVVVSPNYWDLSENTPSAENPIFSPFEPPPAELFPWEVNFVFTVPDFVGANFPEGWLEYTFDYETSCTPLVGPPEYIEYGGAPVIALAWLFGPNGMAIVPSNHEAGHHYDYGWVDYFGNGYDYWAPNYQYSYSFEY